MAASLEQAKLRAQQITMLFRAGRQDPRMWKRNGCCSQTMTCTSALATPTLLWALGNWIPILNFQLFTWKMRTFYSAGLFLKNKSCKLLSKKQTKTKNEDSNWLSVLFCASIWPNEIPRPPAPEWLKNPFPILTYSACVHRRGSWGGTLQLHHNATKIIVTCSWKP